MNIDNSSNISSIVSQSLTKLNLNASNRSYKAGNEEEKNVTIKSKPKENEFLENNIQKTNTVEDVKPKTNIDIDEIRKYANLMGEELSIEDINYGLMYGRSVIADYNA